MRTIARFARYAQRAAKITAWSFPKQCQNGAKQPLKLVHSDVMCISNPETRLGQCYVLNLVDDYSRFGVMYLLKKKREVFDKFLNYQAMAETFHDRKIKTLWSDRGGYMSNLFEEHLTKCGIVRELTVPDTPQQNGVAEHRNETLMSIARCLLFKVVCI